MNKENKAYYAKNPYVVKRAEDGKKYVDWKSVRNDTINISDGNSKVGNLVSCFNFPIFYTCNHSCECFSKEKCYACGGCYNFASNQATYSENYAYYRTHTSDEFVNAVCNELAVNHPKNNLFRYFTCGDIIDSRFLLCMIEIAKRNPHIKFWTYTKKYAIVNNFCDVFGVENIPENLVIIFSHWLNDDGTYFQMENPYEFPTSEFIPIGKEYLAEKVTHICPCSDPNSIEHCANCSTPCYELKHGQSMALLEHSTKASKERDAWLKEAKETIRKAIA